MLRFAESAFANCFIMFPGQIILLRFFDIGLVAFGSSHVFIVFGVEI
jgi:hypothetical protein